MLKFLLCSWEKWNGSDEFFNSGEEIMTMNFFYYAAGKKMYESFISIEEKNE